MAARVGVSALRGLSANIRVNSGKQLLSLHSRICKVNTAKYLGTTIQRKYASTDDIRQSYESNEAEDLDGTVGIERWELLQRVKGIDDPFQLTAKTVAAGTKDKPTLIPTISDQRTVGCLCDHDSPVIKWMRLGVGETKCCECGHWFKLIPLEE